jgi:hypothetical protein
VHADATIDCGRNEPTVGVFLVYVYHTTGECADVLKRFRSMTLWEREDCLGWLPAYINGSKQVVSSTSGFSTYDDASECWNGLGFCLPVKVADDVSGVVDNRRRECTVSFATYAGVVH